ncbi:hypothetical protein [Brevibacillus brevis]|uniref:DUF3994 domain-containing protein n=1 Tax=Brevibacillus brevis TaxID=1393 RepID=A0A517IBG2_BREBE|nr:hypothetical protein [Brevibacillus brevis]QDS36214.1 hypothetical protein FPS98_20585 [Brevibacillus brevis]
MFSIWLPLLLTSSALIFSAIPSHVPTTTTSSAAWTVAVQEFDAFLQDWKKGQTLANLRHPLFDLTGVSAVSGMMEIIRFSGEAHGQAGEITLSFYTLEGDKVFSPPGSVSVARVDEKRREFHVTGAIPRVLRGQTGVVQVTFTGEKRASYLLKVRF